MSQSSSTFSTFEAPAPPFSRVDDGQNHDRMETDIESGQSGPGNGRSEPPGDAADPGLMEVEPPEDGEVMDTRPDSVAPEAPPIVGK